MIDPSFIHTNLETCFGVFKHYFIIYNNEEHLDTDLVPWVTSRTPFGVIFEKNIGYLTEAGISDNWRKNFQVFLFLDVVTLYHNYTVKLGIPERNYTNYFQKAILNRKESNSAELVKQGKPIGVDKIKMLFVLYAICVGISAVDYLVEKYGLQKFQIKAYLIVNSLKNILKCIFLT